MLPRRVVILAFTVALVSGLFSFYISDHPRVDAKAYDKIAWNIARGIGYVEEESLAKTPAADDAIVRVGPGYEFFLAGVYAVVGHQYWVVWLLHALLRGASVIIIYLIAKILFSSAKVAFLAAIFFGLSVDLIVINAFLLTETLFVFLIVASVYATLLYFTKKFSSGIVFLSGFLWALTILVRPVALLPFLVFVGGLLWRRAWKDIVVLCIMPVLLVGSWSTYVTHRYGSFILTTTAGGYDLWVGNNINATGGFEKTPEIQELRNKTHSVELEKISRKKYFEFLLEHPLRFIELQLRKLSIYLDVVRPGGVWISLYNHKAILYSVIVLSVIGNMLFFGAGLAGFWMLAKKSESVVVRAFIAIAVAFPIGTIPIIVETRYRYPFFPFLAIAAAYFIVQKPFNMRLLAKVSSVLVLFVAYDLSSNLESLLRKLNSIF